MDTKEFRGVTLISLIVTIIIMMILVGVTLNLVVGEEGIVGRAIGAKEQHEVAQDKEIINLALATAQISANYKNCTAEALEQALAGHDVQNVVQRGNNISLTLNGRDYRIKPDGEIIQYTYMEPTDVYSKLYEDGTLIFSSKANTTYKDYFGKNVKEPKLVGSYTDYSYPKEQVKVVIFYDEVAPNTAQHMFDGCAELTKINNIEYLHTENVYNMSNMFQFCYKIKTLDLSLFDTSNLEAMNYMFRGCHRLKYLDLSSFNTNKVATMKYLFENCHSLTSIDVSSFNTSKVKTMSRMFSECHSITSLDVSCFDTINVTDMSVMFYNCYNLKSLDLRSFNTNKVTNTSNMFGYCTTLKKIYVNNLFSINSSTNTGNMFNKCFSLVGGAGTTYDSNKSDGTYARIDNPPDAPGYFTLKP